MRLPREHVGPLPGCGTVVESSSERDAVKTLVTLALATGAAYLLRRHRDSRPTRTVWHEATKPTTSPSSVS